MNTPPILLTYYGVDGACSAAIALLAMPGARVAVTSARRVAETMHTLPDTPELHVCGLGVHCPWQELKVAAARLTQRGTRIYWHCARGYLNGLAAELEEIATPVLTPAPTNAAGVAAHFDLQADLHAGRILRLAQRDPNLPAPPEAEAEPEEAFWLDLVLAAISQYVKFQDPDPYLQVVEKVMLGTYDAQDQALVHTFRRMGYKYLLHGDTPAVRELKERIHRCARANRHVIISGESGVGKEHVAHLLWERSPRAMAPFLAVNCALYAGNAGLANSDLFGHKKGTFTGATRDRKGKLVEADGGILFLDELGELPLEVQAKLLRVLEDGRIMPEGADQYERQVDVLVIAATNRSLPAMIREGSFRADLYHRLATLRIEVPPLRARMQDIRQIVTQRLEILAREGRARKLNAQDWEALQCYDWPGNIRQLIKLVERAVLLEMPLREAIAEEAALGPVTRAEEALPQGDPLLPLHRGAVLPLEEVQRAYARRAWELFEENFSATARALDIAPNTLRYKLLAENEPSK